VQLSIVIPAYNEEKRLPQTLERLFLLFRNNPNIGHEILIMDDGSSDGTVAHVQQLQKQHPELKLKVPERNRGRGVVVREGMLAAHGDFVLETDSDGSVADEAIIRFLQFLQTNPQYDVALGSRLIPDATVVVPQPFIRILLGSVFMFLARLLFGWEIHDYTVGFKMFRRDAAQDVARHLYETGFIAEAELPIVAKHRRWRMKELPVAWTDNKDSKVKPLRDTWRSLAGMARMVWRGWRGTYTIRDK